MMFNTNYHDLDNRNEQGKGSFVQALNSAVNVFRRGSRQGSMREEQKLLTDNIKDTDMFEPDLFMDNTSSSGVSKKTKSKMGGLFSKKDKSKNTTTDKSQRESVSSSSFNVNDSQTNYRAINQSEASLKMTGFSTNKN